MKRYLLPLLVCFLAVFCVAGTGSAAPVLQESAGESGTMNPLEMIGVFSQLLTGSIDAAATQLAFGDGPAAAGPQEVPPAEEPVIWDEPRDDMPQDPEVIAVPTDIEVTEYFNTFKRNIKSLGRHNVAFEERGGINASRVEVDGQISILLHYEKTRKGNLLDRITYRAEYENDKQRENIVTVFSCAVSTLCDELGIDIGKAGSNIAEAAIDGRSSEFSGLLLYALSESDGHKTELEVKIYYAGD